MYRSILFEFNYGNVIYKQTYLAIIFGGNQHYKIRNQGPSTSKKCYYQYYIVFMVCRIITVQICALVQDVELLWNEVGVTRDIESCINKLMVQLKNKLLKVSVYGLYTTKSFLNSYTL